MEKKLSVKEYIQEEIKQQEQRKEASQKYTADELNRFLKIIRTYNDLLANVPDFKPEDIQGCSGKFVSSRCSDVLRPLEDLHALFVHKGFFNKVNSAYYDTLYAQRKLDELEIVESDLDNGGESGAEAKESK